MVRGMDLAILRELGEWAALGFYEALAEPWPRAYGRAYRRLYEHMAVRALPGRRLYPVEPLPHARTMESHGTWTATALICDFDHNRGLRVNGEIAAARQQEFPQHAAFIGHLVADLAPRLPHFGCYTHSNPDIRRVVDAGYGAIEAEAAAELAAIEAELARAAAPAPALVEAQQLFLALADYLAGVRAFHARTGAALRTAAAAETDGAARADLVRIAAAFERCFYPPAAGFLEGLLAVHFTWMLDGHDSLGRLDQALGPLFERDLADGRLDLAFARRLLDELWQNFERFNGWNVQLGGYTPDGRDGGNRLTAECLAACARNHQRRPNVALRITRATPAPLLEEALRVLGQGSGRPALYNDDLYVETLRALDLGLTAEDAREVGFGGCTETMIAGLSNVGSLEGSLNLAKALELALHDGRDPLSGEAAGPHTGRFADCPDFAAFGAAVKRQLQYQADTFCAQTSAELRQRFHRGDPKLYRTLLTRDCVRQRRSFEAGGARYNWSVVSYQGIANLIDSLAAIRQCVYEQHSVGATELLAALAADFTGEHAAVQRRLAAAPKFGNDVAWVDELGREFVGFAWEQLYAHTPPRGGRYLPSCILFATYAGAGQQVGATPDGRRAREPLTDSVGAVAGRDTHGPTALLNSVCRLPLRLAAGTPVLNLRFQAALLRDPAGLRGVAALVRAFFAQGGMQIQLSVLSRADMLAAQRDPEHHRDLLVRIGGYSEYFVRLPKVLQDTVLARTEHGL